MYTINFSIFKVYDEFIFHVHIEQKKKSIIRIKEIVPKNISKQFSD